MKVYMAGPIQHAQDYGKGWRGAVKASFGSVDWLDPFDKYDSTDGAETEIRREWTDEEIVEEDLVLIREADAVLVHWEEVPACGTPMEIVYAAEMYGKPVAVQTTVEEPSPWLTAHADFVAQTFQEAIDFLKDEVKSRQAVQHWG